MNTSVAVRLVLSLPLLSGCAATQLTLADGSRVELDRGARRDHEWCLHGVPPGEGAPADTQANSCRLFAEGALRGNRAAWFRYMMKACELGHDGSCASLSTRAVGSEQMNRLTNNLDSDDYQSFCEETGNEEACRRAAEIRASAIPPLRGDLARQVFELAVRRCRQGPVERTSLGFREIGATCFAAAGLLLNDVAAEVPTDLEALVTVRHKQARALELAMWGCQHGDVTACTYAQKNGGSVDLEDVRRRNDAREDADARRLEVEQRDQPPRTKERREQELAELRQRGLEDLQASQRNWRSQMEQINDGVNAAQDRDRERRQREEQLRRQGESRLREDRERLTQERRDREERLRQEEGALRRGREQSCPPETRKHLDRCVPERCPAGSFRTADQDCQPCPQLNQCLATELQRQDAYCKANDLPLPSLGAVVRNACERKLSCRICPESGAPGDCRDWTLSPGQSVGGWATDLVWCGKGQHIRFWCTSGESGASSCVESRF